MTAPSISAASRQVSASTRYGPRSPISSGTGSSVSFASTICCPNPASDTSARSSPVSSCGTTIISSRPRRSWCCDEKEQERERRQGARRGEALHPRQESDLHAGGHQRHPCEVGARPLPHARLLAVQEDPALGRFDVLARH